MPFIVDRSNRQDDRAPVFITKKVGGGAEKLQVKNFYLSSMTAEVTPDSGFDALSKVIIEANVEDQLLYNISDWITTEYTLNAEDYGVLGFSKIKINVQELIEDLQYYWLSSKVILTGREAISTVYNESTEVIG